MTESASQLQKAVGVAAAILLLAASWFALRSRGSVFASVFVDPFANFSAVQLSDWGASDVPFLPSDRLVSIDGVGTTTNDARVLEADLRSLAERGATQVRLGFEHGEATLTLRTIGFDELWWLFGFYALLACSFLWSGFVVWRIAPRRPAAWAYVATTISGFCFLVSFFDYHVTRAITPVFAASSLGNALCMLALALTFPAVPAWAVRWRKPLLAGFALGVVGMVVLALGAALQLDARPLRLAVNVLVPASLATLALSSLGRYLARQVSERRELRWLVFSLGAVPTWLAFAMTLGQALDADWLHLSLPLVGLLVPGGIGLALIEGDFLQTGAMLTRRLLMIPIGFAALALGGAAWAWARAGASQELPGFALCLMTFALTLIAGWTLTTRIFFRSKYLSQALIAGLADRLAELHAPSAVREELALAAQQLLPECRVSVLEQTAAGNHGVETTARWVDRPEGRRLVVPLISGREDLGALSISPRPRGALFTSDELALLETIASLGALALHNAQALGQLEELRRVEANLSREDKRLSVDILAAEMAHELAYPLNYFRHFLRRLARGTAHAPEEVEIGQEEVARLERMIASVRKLQRPQPALKTIELRGVAERAVALLRTELDAREQRVELSLEVSTVRADGDQLLQVLTNLLRNGSQAAGRGGRLGVEARASGEQLVLCVSDDGAGVPEELKARVFSPWFTTRPDGTGLGLAVTQRIVRGFGWTIEVERLDGRTCFLMRGPLADRSA